MSEEKAPSLRTLQADVAALDPLDFPCDLLIASPPCTAFGNAVPPPMAQAVLREAIGGSDHE